MKFNVRATPENELSTNMCPSTGHQVECVEEGDATPHEEVIDIGNLCANGSLEFYRP